MEKINKEGRTSRCSTKQTMIYIYSRIRKPFLSVFLGRKSSNLSMRSLIFHYIQERSKVLSLGSN